MQCLGYRNGTTCRKRVKAPQRRNHWEIYQLCYNCGHDERTITYRNKIDMQLQKIPIIH